MIHDISKDLEKEKRKGDIGLKVIFGVLIILIWYLVYLAYYSVSNNY